MRLWHWSLLVLLPLRPLLVLLVLTHRYLTIVFFVVLLLIFIFLIVRGLPLLLGFIALICIWSWEFMRLTVVIRNLLVVSKLVYVTSRSLLIIILLVLCALLWSFSIIVCFMLVSVLVWLVLLLFLIVSLIALIAIIVSLLSSIRDCSRWLGFGLLLIHLLRNLLRFDRLLLFLSFNVGLNQIRLLAIASTLVIDLEALRGFKWKGLLLLIISSIWFVLILFLLVDVFLRLSNRWLPCCLTDVRFTLLSIGFNLSRLIDLLLHFRLLGLVDDSFVFRRFNLNYFIRLFRSKNIGFVSDRLFVLLHLLIFTLHITHWNSLYLSLYWFRHIRFDFLLSFNFLNFCDQLTSFFLRFLLCITFL